MHSKRLIRKGEVTFKEMPRYGQSLKYGYLELHYLSRQLQRSALSPPKWRLFLAVLVADSYRLANKTPTRAERETPRSAYHQRPAHPPNFDLF